jgi:hypothetical protein
MARFTGIPDVPQGGTDDWQYRVLDTLKQNVELLAGIRGEQDGASAAILRSQVTIKEIPPAAFQGSTAQGGGFTIANVQVPSITDHVALIRDVQTLAQDVANLRSIVSALITQLRR